MLIRMNRYGHSMTVLDSSFCTVETTMWLWKFLSSSLPQCLCQEHEETCSQTKSRRLQENNSGQIVRIMRNSIYNCVQNCENENACSEIFVKSRSAVVIFTAFESNYTASTGLSSF